MSRNGGLVRNSVVKDNVHTTILKQKCRSHMHPLSNLIVLFSIIIIVTFNVHLVPKCKESYVRSILIHTYIHTYIYIYIYTHIHAYIYVCIYVHTYLCIKCRHFTYILHRFNKNTFYAHTFYTYVIKGSMNHLIL